MDEARVAGSDTNTKKTHGSSLWAWLTWGSVFVAVGLGAGAWVVYNHMDEQIRRRVEDKLQGHYKKLKVDVRGAQLIRGEGIQIRGITIRDPRLPGDAGRLAYFHEMMLECDTEMRDLLNGEPRVGRIHVRQPEIRLTRLSDGSWSAAQLLPLPRFSACPPTATVENATVEIIDGSQNPSSRLLLRELNLELKPMVKSSTAPANAPPPAITTAVPARDTYGGVAADPAPDASAPLQLSVVGSLTSDSIRRVDLRGVLNVTTSAIDITGHVEGLDISPEFRGQLPSDMQAKLAALGMLRGRGDLDFALAHDSQATPPTRFDVSGRLSHGSVVDARLPLPLTDVWATFRVHNEGLVVRDLTARNGQSTLRLNLQTQGLAAGGPLWLQAEVRKLLLDRRIYDGLPEKWQDVWRKFSPGGECDAELTLEYDGQTWRPELHARGVNVSASHYLFPYQVDHGEGQIDYKNGTLDLVGKAYTGTRELRMAGRWHRLGPDWHGWFEVAGEEMPIDEKLMQAIPGKPQEVVRSLRPHGFLDVSCRIWRDPEDGAPVHKHTILKLKKASINFDKFAYPLSSVTGTVEVLDQQHFFRDFTAVNDTGRVAMTGKLLPTETGSELTLDFVCAEVPLEIELRDALNPKAQRLWNELKPTGNINFNCQVKYAAPENKLTITLQGEPSGETASLEPRFFQYRMEKLQGKFSYRDGRVDFTDVTAEHGRVDVTGKGYCEYNADGDWTLRLDNLTVERLRIEPDVMKALPGALKTVITKLNPGGTISLVGALEIAGSSKPEIPIRSGWDVDVDFQQGSLDCGVKLENIQGGVRLIGASDGRTTRCQGQLAVDSLTYKNFQFTEVTGPLWSDNDQVLLGAPVSRFVPDRKAQSIVAKICGGTVIGDVRVRLKPEERTFAINARVGEPIDMTRCAQEIFAGRQRISGKFSGFANLHGSDLGVHTFGGDGQVMLRDANIYELPLMVSLLKILSARAPDATAFTKSDVAFRIDAGHVYFDRIDFNGDAISLVGRGSMRPELDMDLRFHALVGRDEMRVPILRDVIGGASGQIMQIHVSGSVEDPVVKRDVLPGVNEAIQQLQQGFGGNPNGGTQSGRMSAPQPRLK